MDVHRRSKKDKPLAADNKELHEGKENASFTFDKRIVFCGILLRIIVWFFLHDSLARQPEWTSPLVSIRRLRDGVAMRRDSVGGHTSRFLPIVLFFFDRIVDVDNTAVVFLLHLFSDVVSAFVLSKGIFIYSCGDATISRRVAACYLLNPLAIGSCASLNMTTFFNLFLSGLVYFFSSGNLVSSVMCLGLSAVSQIYSITLFASLCLRFTSTKERLQLIAGILFSISIWTTLNYAAAGMSWDYLRDVYAFTFWIEDLTPNCGFLWYFFTQVFEHFRTFYIYVFQANAFIYVLPLTLTLRRDPLLHIVLSLLIMSVFSAYPTLGDAAVYMALIPALQKFLPGLRYLLLISCTCVACVCLMPVMWHLWIVSGSGNANFYFAVTLTYGVAQVYLLIDLMDAYFRTEITQLCPKEVCETTSFVMH